MVAATYTEKRRELAVKIGLGNLTRKSKIEAPKPTGTPRVKKLSIKT